MLDRRAGTNVRAHGRKLRKPAVVAFEAHRDQRVGDVSMDNYLSLHATEMLAPVAHVVGGDRPELHVHALQPGTLCFICSFEEARKLPARHQERHIRCKFVLHAVRLGGQFRVVHDVEAAMAEPGPRLCEVFLPHAQVGEIAVRIDVTLTDDHIAWIAQHKNHVQVRVHQKHACGEIRLVRKLRADDPPALWRRAPQPALFRDAAIHREAGQHQRQEERGARPRRPGDVEALRLSRVALRGVLGFTYRRLERQNSPSQAPAPTRFRLAPQVGPELTQTLQGCP